MSLLLGLSSCLRFPEENLSEDMATFKVLSTQEIDIDSFFADGSSYLILRLESENIKKYVWDQNTQVTFQTTDGLLFDANNLNVPGNKQLTVEGNNFMASVFLRVPSAPKDNAVMTAKIGSFLYTKTIDFKPLLPQAIYLKAASYKLSKTSSVVLTANLTRKDGKTPSSGQFVSFSIEENSDSVGIIINQTKSVIKNDSMSTASALLENLYGNSGKVKIYASVIYDKSKEIKSKPVIIIFE